MKLQHFIPDGYKIRLATQADVPLLDGIEAVAGTIFPPMSLPENILAERVPNDVFMKAISQGRLLVAVDSTQSPVGFAFWQDIESSALLSLIEVDPRYGKKGLGTALVVAIIEQVAKDCFSYLYLTTFLNIPWNAPFYQKLGFTLIDDAEQPKWIKDILIEEYSKGLNNRIAMRYSIKIPTDLPRELP